MFSVELTLRENWDELYQWLTHFERTGTPAGLVIDGELISVWRAGRRISMESVNGEVDVPKGILHMQVNNFGRIWKAHKGAIAAPYERRMR